MPELDAPRTGRSRPPSRVPGRERGERFPLPRLLAVGLVLVLTGCRSDVVRPEGDVVTASLQGPAALSAAVVDLAGVEAVEAPGGEAFAKVVDGRLRAVVVLHEPATLTMRLRPTGPESPDVTLVELADGAGEVVADLEGYRVEMRDR